MTAPTRPNTANTMVNSGSVPSQLVDAEADEREQHGDNTSS